MIGSGHAGRAHPAESKSRSNWYSHGVGLRGMRERVAQLGGQLKIDSDTDATAIVWPFLVRLPLPPKASPRATAQINNSRIGFRRFLPIVNFSDESSPRFSA